MRIIFYRDQCHEYVVSVGAANVHESVEECASYDTCNVRSIVQVDSPEAGSFGVPDSRTSIFQ